jgi:transcriptional regulator with XRE-family HTH domain
MHTIPELLGAAAIRLTQSAANRKGVTEAFAAHGRPINRNQVGQWRRSESVPRDEYAAPLAQILGVDPDYVMGCLTVARRRGKNHSRWKSQGSRDHHAASIAWINTLLGRDADDIEREGHAHLLVAKEIRHWASKGVSDRRSPDGFDRGVTVHSVVELIYALDGKFGLETNVAYAKILRVTSATLANWRSGRSIPKETYAVSLALAIGIDFQYVLDCLALARGQPIEGNGLHHAGAIRTVNSLLERSARIHEDNGLRRLQDADKCRSRLREL